MNIEYKESEKKIIPSTCNQSQQDINQKRAGEVTPSMKLHFSTEMCNCGTATKQNDDYEKRLDFFIFKRYIQSK